MQRKFAIYDSLMRIMTTYFVYRILAASAVVVVCATVALYLLVPSSVEAEASRIRSACASVEDTELRACLTREIAALIPNGIPRTFGVIDILYEHGQMRGCHYALHPLGEEAYRLYAESARTDFMVADAAMCNYGFFHGFIIALLRESDDLGLAKRFCDSLDPELLAERPDLHDQCYHGIGHGVLGVYLDDVKGRESDPGWVRANLLNTVPRTLSECESLTSVRAETLNCYSGVFHEVSMLQDDSGWYTDPDDPFWLCREFDGEYRARCYGNMGALFFKIFPEIAAADLVPRALRLYESEHHLVVDIARRYGQLSVMVGRTQERLFENCRGLPTEYQPHCLSGIVAGFVESGERGKEYEAAMVFCADARLTGDESSLCEDQVFAYIEGIYPASKMARVCKEYASRDIASCARPSIVEWFTRIPGLQSIR